MVSCDQRTKGAPFPTYNSTSTSSSSSSIPLLYAKSIAFFEFAVFYYGVCVFFLAVLGPPHLQRTHHVTLKGREALHSWTGLDWLVPCRLCILHHQLLLGKHIPWGTSTNSHDVSERWIRWRGLSRSVCHTIVTLQSIYNQSTINLQSIYSL